MRILNRLARASGSQVKQLRTWRFYGKLVVALLVIAAGFVVGTRIMDNVSAQTSDKETISLGPPSRLPQPIKILDAHVKGRLQDYDKDFQADPDWFGQTSFQVQNAWNKNITFLRISVLFPESRSTGTLMAYPIEFGIQPDRKSQKAEPLLLRPKETLDVNFALDYSRIANFLKDRLPIESVHRIQLEISFIGFDDGTVWSVGTFLRPDPTRPGHYVRLDNDGAEVLQ